MTDYRTINPVIIDTVQVDDVALTSSVPLFFGAIEPADLYVDGKLVASSTAPISVGYLMTPLAIPKWPDVFQPYDISVKAQLLYGFPQTCTEAEFLQGKNVAYVGRQGNWETIYYRDVSIASGVVTLSRILRGQKGGWIYGNGHVPKDTIVFGDLGLAKFTRPLSDIGQTFSANVVPSGFVGSFNSGLGGNLKILGRGIAPWSPVNAHASRAGGDVAFEWTRVDRAPSTMHDGDDFTPLTDSPERYSFGVFARPTSQGAAPVRLVTGLTTPAYLYTAAQQATDGLSGASSYLVIITQDGPIIGHGNPFFGVVNVS